MKKTKDNLQKFVLSNGLTVLLYKMDSVLSVYTSCCIKSGPLWEKPSERGIAHFCEHLLFDGNQKLPDSSAISEYLQEIGAFANAATNTFSTRLWIKSSYNNFEEALTFLYDSIFKSNLNNADIEKEKLIITSEFNDWWQNPENRFNHISLQKRFKDNNHPYTLRSLGTPETISKITKTKIFKWRERFYKPNNMILSVVGNLDLDEVKKDLEKTFGLEKIAKIPPEPKISQKDYSNFTLYVENEERNQVGFFINYPTFGWKEVDRYKEMELGLLNYILGGSPSSRLFIRLREKEKIAYRISSNKGLYPHLGYLEISGSVPSEKLETSFKIIKEEIDNLCKNGITEKETSLARKVFASSSLMRFESPESIANYLLAEELDYGEIHMPEDYVNISEKLEAKEVQKLALKIFSDKRVNISLFGNISNLNTKKLGRIFK